MNIFPLILSVIWLIIAILWYIQGWPELVLLNGFISGMHFGEAVYKEKNAR